MFISRRLQMLCENNLVDDLITTGCQLCGTPVNAGLGSNAEQNSIPLYCQRSSNRLHAIATIYRPFLLYVWDDSKYLPIVVTNKAAQLLFGNIAAEKVFTSYKSQRPCQNRTALEKKHSCDGDHGITCATSNAVLRMEGRMSGDGNLNFYKIWLILLNMLFQHGKNSPLKFEVTVNSSRDWESGRLEMESVSVPAFRRVPSC